MSDYKDFYIIKNFFFYNKKVIEYLNFELKLIKLNFKTTKIYFGTTNLS